MMKRKKVFAIGMSAMMVASLAGCGSADSNSKKSSKESKQEEKSDFFQEVEKIGKIQEGNVTIETSVKIDDKDDSLGIKKALGTDEVKLKVEASTDGKQGTEKISLDLGEGYEDLTDIVLVDETIYVNTSSAIDFAAKYASKFTGSEVTSDEVQEVKDQIGAEYLSISMDDLMELAETESGYSFDENQAALDEETVQKYVEIFKDTCYSPIKKAYAKAKGLLGQDGDKYTLTVDVKNLQTLVDATADFIEDGAYDMLVDLKKALEDKMGEDDRLLQAINKMGDLEEDEFEDLAEAIRKENIQEEIEEEIEDGKIVISAKADSKGGIITAEVSGKSKDEGIGLSVKLSAEVEKAEVKDVTAPESVLSFKDFYNSVYSARTQNDSYDDYSYDDYSYDDYSYDAEEATTAFNGAA